ncbi:hypothetical protein KGM_208661 [Danaus plexippus plexippus]|uniref:Uncharacterized protein n=1 Tax=Danaus plexippus plexippus TaxID=278856 RepID=A0A212EQV0_DANPL|nr:hypothetical protein KGM_208661 [Danaus plexippus plexippus]
MDSSTPFQPWSSDDNSKNVKSERELVDDAKLHRENVNHPKHRQTASYNKESVVDPSVVPGPSSATDTDVHPLGGKESKMDSSKIASMQQIVENTLSQEGRQRVSQLLEAVEGLSGAERLLLYLRLPTGVPPHDPLKQPVNPLGSRAELQQTVTWIQTHLEVDPDVSLPKQDVYDEYIAHCMTSNMKPLSTADFGKVMKQVYPSVRPRRLGTRGNSRYCYAGLRKKVKLEVPQLPNLGESTKEPSVPSRENERIICDWAESKLGVKFMNISELSRHLLSAMRAPPGPTSATPPPQTHGSDEPPGPQLMKQQLKRKLQTQGTVGRPKKNKGQEVAGESPPSTSYVSHPTVKHESELVPESYGYQPAYMPVYDVRPAFPYAAPPRAHPPHPLPPHPHPPPPHPPAIPVHDYRPDPYVFEPPYAPRDLTLPDTAHNVPINLSSDVSLDLSTERTEWQRRRPPDPPAPTARLPLPGKKLILETYQSETQASSPRSSQTDTRAVHQPPEEFPRTEYLPKKMRAAEILGGKLAAPRQVAAADASTSSSTGAESARSEVAFLKDPKNLTNRSKSTAAALAREEQEAASPTRSVKAPTPKHNRTKLRKSSHMRTKGSSPERNEHDHSAAPDTCCGINGINIITGMICGEKHSEILNRERVISICNIDKHDLDDYLNEGNSQEHEEELMQYFHHRDGDTDIPAKSNQNENTTFLETSQDPHDEHSQGKSEKISQLRELLAKNLKSGSNTQNLLLNQEKQTPINNNHETHVNKSSISDGAFRPLNNVMEMINGSNGSNENENNVRKKCDNIPSENGISACAPENSHTQVMTTATGSHLYNGNSHTEPQSPTTRTQQYDFVPISDGCHSPGNFNSKSPLGFGQRGHSPTKTNKPIIMGGSLQTSPISHSMAASPFVSPRNTPVPRSRYCSRPIPKHNNRKRRTILSLGVNETGTKQFAIPNDQKFLPKSSLGGQNIKYCQPMSAPPSPNLLPHFKQQMIQNSVIPNGTSNMCFVSNTFRENVNGEMPQPLSADPLSSEVSQFFQEPVTGYRIAHDTSFRSQSVPLKQATINIGLLSYNNTPVGSVPPTPVPNEFCDFGSLADTCDISRAGLNPETLDKIYDAIDSSNDVLNGGTSNNILNSSDTLTNGCDPLPEQQILIDEQLSSLIPSGEELLDRSSLMASGEDLLERGEQFNESFPNDSTASENVEEFLKRTNSIEFDLSDLVTEKNKYYASRSVPSTPLPYKRTASNLQIDPRHARDLFATENYSSVSNGISSKSVPSTPQLAEDRSVFSYTNRDFLINGNSVDMCSNQIRQPVENDQALTSPLDEILGPLTPAADLLADLDKIDTAPYVDL